MDSEWPQDEFDENESSSAGIWLNAATLCSAVAHNATLTDAACSIGYGERGPSWTTALKMLQLQSPLEAEAVCMTQYRALLSSTDKPALCRCDLIRRTKPYLWFTLDGPTCKICKAWAPVNSHRVQRRHK